MCVYGGLDAVGLESFEERLGGEIRLALHRVTVPGAVAGDKGSPGWGYAEG